MSEAIELFKKRLQAEEEGLVIRTEKWVCIHETPCFYFCVEDRRKSLVTNALKHTDETAIQAAKRLKFLKRISKQNSRFAFVTEQAAMDHLRFLKRRQLMHMERETKFINLFLECEELEASRYDNSRRVPESRGLVREFLRFD